MPTRIDLFGLGADRCGEPYHHKVFEELLYDAVHLAYMSADERKADESTTKPNNLARASVLNSLLLPECAANCCLDSLPWSAALRRDAERLPAMSKCELFVASLMRPQGLDRGAAPAQRVEELKNLRDRYVHPKVRKYDWQQVSEDAQCADVGHTPMLGIPLDASTWEAAIAVVALRVVTDFFNHYFLDVCGFNSNMTCEILLGTGEVKLPFGAGYAIDCVGELDRAIDEWAVSFRFLGKGESGIPPGVV